MKTLAQIKDDANLLRLLYTLVKGGITFPEALTIAACTFDSFRQALTDFVKDITSGLKDYKALTKQQASLPSYLPPLITAWELSGKKIPLDQVLYEAAVITTSHWELVEAGFPQGKIDEINFYRTLGMLISLGVPILTALHVVGDLYLPPQNTALLIKEVSKGSYISEAMEVHENKKYFSASDIALISIGEQSGNFPVICTELAEIKERLLFISFDKTTNRSIPSEEVLEGIYDYIQIGHVYDAGLPLPRVLMLVSEKTTSAILKIALRDTAMMLQTGRKPSMAMASLPPTYFPPWAIEMVKMGEVHGSLEKTFMLIANHFKWEVLGITPNNASELTVAVPAD